MKITTTKQPGDRMYAEDFNDLGEAINSLNLPTGELIDEETGKVSELALPTVNILPFFDPDYFQLGANGKIQPINTGGGTELPVPSPPTNFVVNDTDNTAGFTNVGGLTNSDTEVSKDGGTTWTDNSANPFPVGNVALAVGKVRVRYKATSQRKASVSIFNATAYTVSSDEGVDAGFTKMPSTGFVESFIFSRFNENSYTFHNADDGGPSYNSGSNVFNGLKVAPNTAATIRFDANLAKEGFWIGFQPDKQDTGSNQSNHYISTSWHTSSNGSGKWQVKPIDNSQGYPETPLLTPASGASARFQFRFTGTRIYCEYSKDSGQTWTDISPSSNFEQPNEDLYIHCWAVYLSGDVINLIQKGMTSAV